ncbi:hypothetical protein BV898_19360 [Hypsibius exemplaris]|uniref:Gustatory receptor n=1 Tax=Hypsibius exemplaris TaxID=2072580 RepID=A0A9X6NLB9_HYPEX|nr:hypothetical protein BV898_19360 [Hypsibius exemplaris]
MDLNNRSLQSEVFPVPCFVLRCFGLLPPTPRFLYYRCVFLIILIVHLVGGFTGVAQQMIGSLISIIYDPNENVNQIISIFLHVPYISEALRGVVVLGLFLRIRCTLPSVLRDLSCLCDNVFEQEQKTNLQQRWRTITSICSVGSLIVHALWEASGWINYTEMMTTVAAVEAAKNTTMESPKDSASFRFPLAFWFACVYFEFVLFVVSQQVVVTSVMMSAIFAGVVRGVNSKIRHLRKRNKISLTELSQIEQLHGEQRRFVHKLNELFSIINLAWYFLDFTTCLGYLAASIVGNRQVLEQYVVLYGSIAIYGAYATVCFLPLIMVDDEGSRIELNLYRLAVFGGLYSLDTRTPQLNEELWLQAVRRLQLSCEEQPIGLEAGGNLMAIDRGFFARTLTFSVSFGLVAYEIVNIRNH